MFYFYRATAALSRHSHSTHTCSFRLLIIKLLCDHCASLSLSYSLSPTLSPSLFVPLYSVCIWYANCDCDLASSNWQSSFQFMPKTPMHHGPHGKVIWPHEFSMAWVLVRPTVQALFLSCRAKPDVDYAEFLCFYKKFCFPFPKSSFPSLLRLYFSFLFLL